MSSLTEATKKRFHEASVEREALMEKMKPTHRQHKALTEQIQALEAQVAELATAMRPTRDRLFDLENEIARCARFCKDGDGKSRMGKREEVLNPAEIEAAKARAVI